MVPILILSLTYSVTSGKLLSPKLFPENNGFVMVQEDSTGGRAAKPMHHNW